MGLVTVKVTQVGSIKSNHTSVRPIPGMSRDTDNGYLVQYDFIALSVSVRKAGKDTYRQGRAFYYHMELIPVEKSRCCYIAGSIPDCLTVKIGIGLIFIA